MREINCFLVDVKVSQRNEITILFDKNDGLYVDDCITLSKHIESHFDRNMEDYKLTVCSPGIESPFLVKEQYFKNIGNDVEIKTFDNEIIKGKLISCDKGIVIENQDQRKTIRNKKVLEKTINISKDRIKEAKLILKFK